MKLASITNRFLSKDYPYMNARVSAKGAKLLTKQDYEQLLKMEPNEIARRLEEGAYSEEINALGSELEGVQLVEVALRNNLANTMNELADISPESLEKIIGVYTRRYDITAYKTLLRWKKSGQEENIEAVISPGHSLSNGRIQELSEKPVEEIIEEISFDSDIDYSERLQDAESIEEIENALDETYFTELKKTAVETGNTPFIKFVEREIEYENLTTVLRLKKNNVGEEEIRERLIQADISDLVEEAVGTSNFEELVELLEESDLGIKSDSIEQIEHELDVTRLERALSSMKTEVMGLTSVIAYILAKTVEVRNLRMLIQAKSTGVQDEDQIRENLVIAG